MQRISRSHVIKRRNDKRPTPNTAQVTRRHTEAAALREEKIRLRNEEKFAKTRAKLKILTEEEIQAKKVG